MKGRMILLMAALMVVGLTAACGGGGGGGGAVSTSPLAGTWFGVMEDINDVRHTLKITIAENNTVTSEEVDGVVTGATYSISHVTGQIYSVTAGDGTRRGFYVDGSFTHLSFVDEDWNFGVLQKGATSVPSYAEADVIGSWSGIEVRVDGFFDYIEAYASSVTVLSNGSFTGSNKYGSFSGDISSYLTMYGIYFGTYSSNAGDGIVRVFVSPDKTFAGSWACLSSGFFPEDCTFSAWNKL